VDFEQHPNQTELARLLVAADVRTDPHLQVKLCCERARSEPLTVSLLVPGDDEWSGSSARAVRLLGWAATLFHAAGVRVEDV
jgi:hypothetical protein